MVKGFSSLSPEETSSQTVRRAFVVYPVVETTVAGEEKSTICERFEQTEEFLITAEALTIMRRKSFTPSRVSRKLVNVNSGHTLLHVEDA